MKFCPGVSSKTTYKFPITFSNIKYSIICDWSNYTSDALKYSRHPQNHTATGFSITPKDTTAILSIIAIGY